MPKKAPLRGDFPEWGGDGRAGGIRTHGLFVPNEARYQTALQPERVCPMGSIGAGDYDGWEGGGVKLGMGRNGWVKEVVGGLVWGRLLRMRRMASRCCSGREGEMGEWRRIWEVP